jgi:hypothetical protein
MLNEYPKALLKNPDKLKQVQDVVFSTILSRLEVYGAVCALKREAIDTAFINHPPANEITLGYQQTKKEYSMIIRPGLISPLSSGLAPIEPNIYNPVGEPEPGRPGKPDLFDEVYEPTRRSYFPQVLGQWENMEGRFKARMGKMLDLANQYFKELEAATGLPAVHGDNGRYANYGVAVLFIFNKAFAYPQRANLLEQPEGPSLMMDSYIILEKDKKAIKKLSAAIIKLATDKPGAEEVKAGLLGLVPEIEALEKTIRQVLALVPFDPTASTKKAVKPPEKMADGHLYYDQNCTQAWAKGKYWSFQDIPSEVFEIFIANSSDGLLAELKFDEVHKQLTPGVKGTSFSQVFKHTKGWKELFVEGQGGRGKMRLNPKHAGKKLVKLGEDD